jgi:hypothetical protein
MSYRLDSEAGVVEILGPFSPGEFHRLLAAILINPAYRSGFGFLRDRREMGVMSNEAILQAVAIMGQFKELAWSRWAYIAVDAVNLDVVRRAALFAHAKGIEVEAFPNEQRARRWLAERRPAR